MIVTVPRILNRIYGKIYDEISRRRAMVQNLFNRGINAKTHYL
jgi:long-subunit acyl-CoA synthetase (AMP-forming)